MGTAIKHPVPDRVKPSFVIFDIRTLTHMATVGVKGLSDPIRTPPIAGTSTPYKRWSKFSMEKVKGEVFAGLFQEIKGEAKISLLIVALISSANYNLIYCKWLT